MTNLNDILGEQDINTSQYCRYTHKTKCGEYKLVTTATAAGDMGDMFASVVVYKNSFGEVFVRSLESFKDNMRMI